MKIYTPTDRIGTGGGGVEEEDIDVLEITFPDALNRITIGEIKDAKTVILLQHLQLKNWLQA